MFQREIWYTVYKTRASVRLINLTLYARGRTVRPASFAPSRSGKSPGTTGSIKHLANT